MNFNFCLTVFHFDHLSNSIVFNMLTPDDLCYAEFFTLRAGGWEFHPFFGKGQRLVACVDLLWQRAVQPSTRRWYWDLPIHRVFPTVFAVAFVLEQSSQWSFASFGLSTWMPPNPSEVKSYTITELITTLLHIVFELSRRFRIPVPEAPEPDVVTPFHCAVQCDHCSSTCFRIDRGHRRHLCRAHLNGR